MANKVSPTQVQPLLRALPQTQQQEGENHLRLSCPQHCWCLHMVLECGGCILGRGVPVRPPRLVPVSHQEPGLFEADVVSSQLRYAGILETIRIRKEGFPIRIPFLVFIDRCLPGSGSQRGDTTKLVGVLGGRIWPEDPPQWELPSSAHSTGRSCFPGQGAQHRGEGPCQCPGRGPTW